MTDDPAAMAGDAALRAPDAFVARGRVIDRLDFLLAAPTAPGGDAARFRSELESVDDRLFADLRHAVRGGLRGAAFRKKMDACVPGADRLPAGAPGYDALDVFLDGMLLGPDKPHETRELESEMVGCQQIPARVILDLIDSAALGAGDLFCDVGSGLGRACLLVNLLTGASSRGVEFEPAFCDFARRNAAELNLQGTEFVNADARAVDYAGVTVFFLYTPFRGRMLREALDRIVSRAVPGALLFTYGPCTAELARDSRFILSDGESDNPNILARFAPRP